MNLEFTISHFSTTDGLTFSEENVCGYITFILKRRVNREVAA